MGSCPCSFNIHMRCPQLSLLLMPFTDSIQKCQCQYACKFCNRPDCFMLLEAPAQELYRSCYSQGLHRCSCAVSSLLLLRSCLMASCLHLWCNVDTAHIACASACAPSMVGSVEV